MEKLIIRLESEGSVYETSFQREDHIKAFDPEFISWINSSAWDGIGFNAIKKVLGEEV